MVLVRVTEHVSCNRERADQPSNSHFSSTHSPFSLLKNIIPFTPKRPLPKRLQGLSHQICDFPHILRLQFRERSLFRDCPHGLLSNQYLERSRASVSSDVQLAVQLVLKFIGHAYKGLSHLRHGCSGDGFGFCRRRRGAFFRRRLLFLFLHR